jgi:hypothetical protein
MLLFRYILNLIMIGEELEKINIVVNLNENNCEVL